MFLVDCLLGVLWSVFMLHKGSIRQGPTLAADSEWLQTSMPEVGFKQTHAYHLIVTQLFSLTSVVRGEIS